MQGNKKISPTSSKLSSSKVNKARELQSWWGIRWYNKMR